MSSTGQNRRDRALRWLGDYATPAEVVEASLDVLLDDVPLGSRVLEAHVGAGNWLRGLAARRPDLRLEVMDVDPLAPGYELARELGAVATPPAPSVDLVRCGFLVTDPAEPPDWTIGNPPYSVAEERVDDAGEVVRHPEGHKHAGDPVINRYPVLELHVRRALEVSRVGVAYVVPAGFLGSGERVVRSPDHEIPLYGLGLLDHVGMYVPRIPFVYGSTDSTENVLAIWRKDRDPAKLATFGHIVWHRPKKNGRKP